jgi:DNA polymerase gamma 1
VLCFLLRCLCLIFHCQSLEDLEPKSGLASQEQLPAWYVQLLAGPLDKYTVERILPLLLNLSFDGHPLQHTAAEKWHFNVNGIVTRLPTAGKSKTTRVLGPTHGLPYLKNGRLNAIDISLTMALSNGDVSDDTVDRVLNLAKRTFEETDPMQIPNDPWLSQLNWMPLVSPELGHTRKKDPLRKSPKPPPVLWPKWYWELTKPKKGLPPGTLEITVRNRVAPLLLRLSWLGWPLFYSREHGWVFRVPTNNGTSATANATAGAITTRSAPLEFHNPADDVLQEAALRGGFTFHKLPHKDGEHANVGSPIGKAFMSYALDGTLRSPGGEAREALEMSAQCSYWIGARDRISKQMVVWQDSPWNLGFPAGEAEKWGMILPQVITMGTVTRRAIEKTWLTASNAKPNRVGSELKAMVRAPPGYSIVGADVDSEELWISSCMGDAQFGMHGATALGWMTLEGTKAAGTDLHSKTASILGISRDQAKVFNYSRIYGAGMRHAVQLLLQGNAGMLPEKAQKLAENLYASTKGRNTHRTDMFGRKFWYGGTESFVFNKLEEIALSNRPQTPALGCGVTYALSKEYLPAEFGADYMPSRINWVVQSSGVDYLHLLIVAMEHLIAKYDIEARYLLSVHDELRYLVADRDQYRAALALQIANLWTRCLFAYKLGMDDLPQGVAFFSAVDVDKVLRKEVDMPCVTPSQTVPIPPGESLNIEQVLAKTGGGSLWKDGRPMGSGSRDWEIPLEGYNEPDCLVHRADSVAFLRAQATAELAEVKFLAKQVSGKGNVGGGRGGQERAKKVIRKTEKQTPVGNGDDLNWEETVEEMLKHGTKAQMVCPFQFVRVRG